MFLLWHPSLTAINLSYTFPIFETSATALCGTTGISQYVQKRLCGVNWEFGLALRESEICELWQKQTSRLLLRRLPNTAPFSLRNCRWHIYLAFFITGSCSEFSADDLAPIWLAIWPCYPQHLGTQRWHLWHSYSSAQQPPWWLRWTQRFN